jgi:hypothetical protein
MSEIEDQLRGLTRAIESKQLPIALDEVIAPRRNLRNLALALAVAVTVVVAGIALAVWPHSSRSVRVSAPAGSGFEGKVGWPDTFVAKVGDSDVVVADAQTAKPIATIYRLPAGEWNLSGSAIDTDGHVWITINHGPVTPDGVHPRPHTCASQVIDINPATNTATTVIHGSDDELIADANPSPAGDRIALLHSRCATSLLNNVLQVRTLAGDEVVTIGSKLGPCHELEQPRWTADGRLAVLYGQATEAQYGQGMEGEPACPDTQPARIVVVDAGQDRPDVTGTAVEAPSGCKTSAVTTTKDGYAAIAQCQVPNSQWGNDDIDGPIYLLRYDTGLRETARTELGRCGSGPQSISGTPNADTVLISTYQLCLGSSDAAPLKLVIDTANRPDQLGASSNKGPSSLRVLAF